MTDFLGCQILHQDWTDSHEGAPWPVLTAWRPLSYCLVERGRFCKTEEYVRTQRWRPLCSSSLCRWAAAASPGALGRWDPPAHLPHRTWHSTAARRPALSTRASPRLKDVTLGGGGAPTCCNALPQDLGASFPSSSLNSANVPPCVSPRGLPWPAVKSPWSFTLCLSLFLSSGQLSLLKSRVSLSPLPSAGLHTPSWLGLCGDGGWGIRT